MLIRWMLQSSQYYETFEKYNSGLFGDLKKMQTNIIFALAMTVQIELEDAPLKMLLNLM